MKMRGENVFKPADSKGHAKSDRTNDAVRSIIKSEVASRNAKTERLRAARLAREAAEPAPEAPKPVRKSRAKAAK